jgi:molecular chaperone GrpE
MSDRPDEVPRPPDDASGGEAPGDSPAAGEAGAATDGEAGEAFTLEALLADLERVTTERDAFLALAQRTQAEFENYRKRASRQVADDVARETGRLAEAILPVLDAFDYAAAHGDDGGAAVGALREQLLGVLAKEGLVRLDPTGEPFDPTEHDAVAHEPGDGGEPVVAETLRAGYRWQNRLLRPAMVRVKD